MKIDNFTKMNFNVFKKDLELALKEIEDKYEMKHSNIKIRYSLKNATIKFDLNIVGETGEAETKEKQAFFQYCDYFGIQKDWFGQKIKFPDGVIFILQGFDMRKSKNKVLLKDLNGKNYYSSINLLKQSKKHE